MLLSVFTPTHNPTYLNEVWACLRKQTHQHFEWIVVPNGDMAEAVAAYAEQITEGDKRVRIITAPETIKGVGALKKFACDQCQGSVYVEYDHDDLITDDCLATVHLAAAKGPPVSFIYSDDVTMGFDGSPHKFMTDFGWRHETWEYEGKHYHINKQPDPHPRALCEILYAPDHVRAWTALAYKLVGGHNPALEVGDDHELIVRTYLKGVHFEHIQRPLYLHRLNKETTSQTSLEKISQTSWQTRDRYLYALVAEWCRREKLPMFDLGGAHNSPQGYTPIDKALPEGNPYKGDVFAVLEAMPDKSIGCVRASDFLEHIPPGDPVIRLMNLVYQKLVPGGFFLTHTPAICDNAGKAGRGAIQDPTHLSFWSPNNFWYFTNRDYSKFVPAIKCRFQTVRVFNYYPSDFNKDHLIPYVLWDGMSLQDDDVHYFPGPRNI